MSEDFTDQPIKNDGECEAEEPIKRDDVTFLFAGAHYGWGPLQLVMEQNGICHNKCGDDTEVWHAQTGALINVQLVGQITVIALPLLGELSDRKGAQYVAYFLTAMTFVGLLLIIIADQTNAYWIMYIASLCLVLAAWKWQIAYCRDRQGSSFKEKRAQGSYQLSMLAMMLGLFLFGRVGHF